MKRFRGRTVLVTGGAGFIGSHLVDALVDEGASVRVLDNLSTGSRGNLEQHAEAIDLLEGDLRDIATCERAVKGTSCVFHQAALGSVPRSLEDPAATFAHNVQGTVNLFSSARAHGVRRIVYASSSSVYGDSDTLPKREGQEGRPLSPYALSKRINEETASLFATCFSAEPVGLRYFNVYGPRQDPSGPYAAVIPRFFEAFRRGSAPLIHGDGEQSRDFTFVADVVEANLLAALADPSAAGQAYNIGSTERTTVNRLASLIAALTGTQLQAQHGPNRAGDVRHSLADITKARRALGYNPAQSVEEGLRKTALLTKAHDH